MSKRTIDFLTNLRFYSDSTSVTEASKCKMKRYKYTPDLMRDSSCILLLFFFCFQVVPSQHHRNRSTAAPVDPWCPRQFPGPAQQEQSGGFHPFSQVFMLYPCFPYICFFFFSLIDHKPFFFFCLAVLKLQSSVVRANKPQFCPAERQVWHFKDTEMKL